MQISVPTSGVLELGLLQSLFQPVPLYDYEILWCAVFPGSLLEVVPAA